MTPLKILHVLRAPLGGAFRHVLDVALGQALRGHRVGIVVASGGSTNAEERLNALASHLALGISRIPMQRQPGLSDVMAVRFVMRTVATLKPDVVHGHGAKGGALARLAAKPPAIRVYTPHGGSLHYGRNTPAGMIYGAAERFLMRRTELFLFESAFARETFTRIIGAPRGLVRVVANGISAAEMIPVPPAADATDLVFVGELRQLKGPDVLIAAIEQLARAGRRVTATIVGIGDDAETLRKRVAEIGLEASIRFAGFRLAREAFTLGRILVMPSRAESLPYIVLEAAGAGLPVIATRVGGVPEIFGPNLPLVPPGHAAALAGAVAAALDDPAACRAAAERLRERVRAGFSQESMVEGILTAYNQAISSNFPHSH